MGVLPLSTSGRNAALHGVPWGAGGWVVQTGPVLVWLSLASPPQPRSRASPHHRTETRFSTLRDELQLTDGNLNRRLKILEDAQLLQVRKGYEGRRPCTWLRLTRQERDALRHEITTLEQLVHRVRGTPARPPTQPATADPDGTR